MGRPKKEIVPATAEDIRAEKMRQYEALVRKETELLQKMKEYKDNNLIEFFDKAPNPGPNPRQAEILEGWLEPYYKTFTFCGGNRLGKCLTSNTYIETLKGNIKVGDLFEDGKPFQVYAWNGDERVVAKASPPFKKDGLHQCYRVLMTDGRWFEAADHHRILTSCGWLSIQDVLYTYSPNLQDSISEHGPLIRASNDLHSTEIPLNSMDRYSLGLNQYDVPFHFYSNIFQESVPLSDDSLTHTPPWWNEDGLDNIHRDIPRETPYPLSNQYVLNRIVDQFFESLSHNDDKISLSFLPGYLLSLKLSNAEAFEFQLNPLTVQHLQPYDDPPFDHTFESYKSPFYIIGENSIESITSIPTCQEVYDFEVEKYHNYFAGGVIHHNTTLDVLMALSTMFGKYPWNNKSLLHLYNHNKARKVRYIGQDWEKHIKSVVMPELEKWWPKSRPVKQKKNNVGIDSLWIDEKTGSTLEIMSNGQESELHEGWSGDLIVYDEPPKRDIRIANARGLVDRLGRELFCMTLLKEAWVDREVIKATLPDGKPDPRVFNVHGESYDNIGYGITREGLEIFASKLTEEERDARLKGIPSYMSGLVYGLFSRKNHLTDRFQVPLDWMVDIAIDVHPREKQAILFVATDPRNERYVVEEIWDHGDAKWIAESVLRAIRYSDYRVNRIVIDPLAKGDSNNPQSVYEKVASILLNKGYVLEVATKDKAQGILEVKKHLMGPNKKPSIFFFNDLVRTIFEIEGYLWDEQTQKCVDKDDHFMENLYRILLLNTKWVEADDYASNDNRLEEFTENRDAMTGY